MAGIASKHLIRIEDLTVDEIYSVLENAATFKEINTRTIKKLPTLRGRTIINMFLEPSTRTRSSFELAEKRLSADSLNFSASSSATVKGESLLDTAETFDAMKIDMVIVRHRYGGSPWILAEAMDAHIINGGDGIHQHPTQTLLDLFTIQEAKGRIAGLTVGIVGDIYHSRVAGSLAPALKMMGARPICIAPPSYQPDVPEALGAEVSHSLDEALPDLDVVYLLRIQGERAQGLSVPSLREYATVYGMNQWRMDNLMKPDAIIMHPGPMNRGVEITPEVIADSRSLVLDQVNAGVAVRMAVMYQMLGGEGDVATAAR
ncbi:MAG: aspartate carbamoyltransferase catalytic subunit [Actinomycetes bacterium]|jgi:aspartate carbamoyltransferase catalytic subunit|nr:aspartate carbamoyltransferase catalytic subunit [Actinomycetes bacterium]